MSLFSEHLSGELVDFLVNNLVNTGVNEARAAIGDGGNEEVAGTAVFAADALDFCTNLFLGGIGPVHDGGVNAALQSHASADLLLEL